MIWIWAIIGIIGHEVAHYVVARGCDLNARFVWHPKWYLGGGVKYWAGDGETVKVTEDQRLVVCLAGPMFNLLIVLFIPAAFLPNITIFLVNILPIKGSDGWNIVRSLK